jgi:hypothetical protein
MDEEERQLSNVLNATSGLTEPAASALNALKDLNAPSGQNVPKDLSATSGQSERVASAMELCRQLLQLLLLQIYVTHEARKGTCVPITGPAMTSDLQLSPSVPKAVTKAGQRENPMKLDLLEKKLELLEKKLELREKKPELLEKRQNLGRIALGNQNLFGATNAQKKLSKLRYWLRLASESCCGYLHYAAA